MFRWVAKQYRLITDEHEWFRRSVSGHDFRLLKPGLAARQLGVPAVGLGACCWFGVGAGAGDECAGPGGEGVAGDGWRADAVRAEEPGSVLAGVPGDHVPQRRAHQQTMRFGPPVRAAALLVPV